MSEPLTIKVRSVQGYRVVEVCGEIDIASGPTLRTAIEAEVASGTQQQLIVDLGRVRFMDSSGLSLLMGMARRLGPESLGVAGSQTHLGRIFSLTGSDKLIPVFDSVSAAIESMRREDPPG